MAPVTGATGDERRVTKSDRTRESILAAGREIFTRKGFSRTTIGDIAAASGIHRANFYYYFADKDELFIALGTATYREVRAVVESFGDVGADASVESIKAWVVRYFDYLDRNGAFSIRSQEDAPEDPDFRRAVAVSHRRTATSLGEQMEKVMGTAMSTDSLGLGVAVMALLDRSWILMRTELSPVSAETLTLDTLAQMIHRIIA